MTTRTIAPETWISVLEGGKIAKKPVETLKEGDTMVGARGKTAVLSDSTTEGT
eukprot:CAMPEP_0115035654 /NCGR_PEP_ID=MMETSP0216-20121206/41594_1 /TAXON_ID=223996 /ORGANISM="Protocruzia adherens, Strain Boccale" /LENGTH=52 /DNA_ID=CAMNT_0002415209 /DNA_START=40 /DNA_END=194 /DNA_ORIENTATION=-